MGAVHLACGHRLELTGIEDFLDLDSFRQGRMLVFSAQETTSFLKCTLQPQFSLKVLWSRFDFTPNLKRSIVGRDKRYPSKIYPAGSGL